MTQYSGMSFSLWECMSARERDEHVWLYKILNNGLGKKCSFPFGQWPTVICTSLCDFPRRMWGHPLLWSVCWMWSWPWLQMQKTFPAPEGREGGTCREEWTVSVWRGRGERSLSFPHLRWIRAPFPKQVLCSDELNHKRERATLVAEICWVFRVYFPLMIDKSGPNRIPFFRKENTKNHIFPLHFSSHIEKSHRGIDTSFG